MKTAMDKEKPDNPETNYEDKDDLRPEYDFSNGVRGKYLDLYRKACGTAQLDPDVAEAFPTDEAVNEALRIVIRMSAVSGMIRVTKNTSPTKCRTRQSRQQRQGGKKLKTA